MIYVWAAVASTKGMQHVETANSQEDAEKMVEEFLKLDSGAFYVIATAQPEYNLDSEQHGWLLDAQA